MPFGSFRLNSLAKYTAPISGASWADWTNTDVGSVQSTAGTVRDFRTSDVVRLNNNFYHVGFLDSSRTSGYAQKYTLSGSTLTYSSETTFTNQTVCNILNTIAISLPTFDKAIYFYYILNGLMYYNVYEEVSGTFTVHTDDSISMSTITSYAGTTSVCVDPNDNSKIVLMDRKGNIIIGSFNNSTNEFAIDSEVVIANVATDSAEGWMVDKNGTTQFCCIYRDSSTQEWKIYQADMDGSNLTTYTLGDNDTLNFATYTLGRNAKLYKTNPNYISLKGMFTNSLKIWYATWDGSSWTQSSSEYSFATSNFGDASFQQDMNYLPGITNIDNTTFLIHYLRNTNTSYIQSVISAFNVSGGAVNLIDKKIIGNIAGNTTYSVSNADDAGFEFTTDYNYIIISVDDTENGNNLNSLSVLVKPT